MSVDPCPQNSSCRLILGIFKWFSPSVHWLFLCLSDILYMPYCLKNNDGHVSSLRHLVRMCYGRWLFLLSRGEAEHSADQPQSFCYPQVRLDKSAPYWDRGRRVLSGRNMNQMKALGFHFKRKMPLAAPFVFGCMGGQAFY